MDKINIIIDFDGTCVTHDFPVIGKSIGAEKVLKRLTDNGHNLILFTMRSDRLKNGDTGDDSIEDVIGPFLSDAIQWFKDNDIPLWGIQTNPTQHIWTTSPKPYAHLMIDDIGLGCPLKYNSNLSNKPFVDWVIVEKMLEDLNLI